MKPSPRPQRQARALAWLYDLFETGPEIHSLELQDRAQAAGHRWRTVQRVLRRLRTSSYNGLTVSSKARRVEGKTKWFWVAKWWDLGPE
jgi:hypothetical protein